MCGGAETLAFDLFVVAFYLFLLCELSSKNPSNMFLNFGKKCLFFGLPTLHFVFDGAQALVFGLLCVCVCVGSSSPQCKPSMISTSSMVSLSLARFVVGD